MNQINIKKLFYSLQNQMVAQLNTNREYILHPTSKGDSYENNWIDWLNEYLPNRYKVDKAFIIDSKGELSQQIDVVIYDQQYSPFVFTQNGIIYIPAESVYAVFEVKPEINKEYIKYTGEKIESVRKLHRTSADIYDFRGKHKGKPPSKILGGILALKSSWTPAFGNSFKKHIKDLNEKGRMDIGCAIESGGFLIEYGKRTKYKCSNEQEALIFFFLKLLEELQKLATVPAIDIKEYAKALDSI